MGLKSKFSSSFWLHFFGMTSFLTVVFLGCQIGLRIYTQHGQGIEVPDVQGMSFSEAERKIHSQELEVLVVDSDYIKMKPAGSILDQSPKPGLLVKRNRTVYLTINASNSPTLALPDLADNSSKRQAMVKLQSMGLKLTAPETVNGELDWVYAIKYQGKKIFAGDRIPSDATLTLVIGNGSTNADAGEDTEITEAGTTTDKKDNKKTDTKKKADDWF